MAYLLAGNHFQYVADLAVVLCCLSLVFFWLRKYRSVSFLPRWISGWLYLVKGPEMIQDGYTKRNAEAFYLSTPSNDHLIVSSPKHIKEYTEASPSKLSLHAAAKEFLQPKYTMHGFEWKDQRGVEGTGFVRALRTLMTQNLGHFIPILSSTIEHHLKQEIAASSLDGESRVAIHPMIKRLVTKANCIVFFGQGLANNEEFTAAALRLPEDVIFAGEILRLTPEFLCPTVAHLVTRGHRSAKTLTRYLTPIVEERLEIRRKELAGTYIPAKPIECIQWLIDTSPRTEQWSVARTVGEIIAVWFSSVHQVAMTATFLVHDFCLQDKEVEAIQEELMNADVTTLANEPHSCVFPLLDSFIRESMRVNGSDAVAGRRKVLESFRFSDGVCAAPGDWICVPQKAILHDEQYFPGATIFDGRRFLDRARLTDAAYPWVAWGCGKTTCPGRFYASAVLKLIAFHVLRQYRCRLKDGRKSRNFVWRSAIVPLDSTIVIFLGLNQGSTERNQARVRLS